MYVECFQKSGEGRRRNGRKEKYLILVIVNLKKKKIPGNILEIGNWVDPRSSSPTFFWAKKKYHREIFTVVQP